MASSRSSAHTAREAYNHLLLLCETTEGYHNLCRLSTLGYLEGWHYKPRVDDDLLEKYKEGLICSSACLGGRIPQAILNEDIPAAREAIEKYIGIFGKDRFFIELMEHGLPEETIVNPVLAELAGEYGLDIIATNDCHYLDAEDVEAHDALLCVQTGTTMDDEKRFKLPNGEFYFRSPDEMAACFTRWPEAIENTVKLAKRCNVEIPLDQNLIPAYDVPAGYADKIVYLRELVMRGLAERYGEPPAQKYVDRAEFELGVIERMQFADYFLVVWDLISYARKNGIPVGPGRGSGAGSIVAYALQITNIDPMRYSLLFERFLNPERVSMPDFDIDFCYNRREEVIEYAYEKYGRENVSQIITFGRMLAKNVVRNVGRVLGMSYGDVDAIAKLIPDELKIKLKSAAQKEPELRARIDSDPQVAKLWRLAERLEGTIGNCGTHAAGVVICDHPLTDHVALFKAANSDTVATQVEMTYVEKVGLLKMDFLGLRTLTVVHDAVRMVKDKRGIGIDIDNLEPDDVKTYALLRSGQTTGIFQLESSGMRDLAKRIGLQSLEEMSALVALYRPGPMQFIDKYIEGKLNPETIQYDHPITKPILEETYGIAVYQEQVMQLVQACAGFSLGRADIVRRAMSKKKKDLLGAQRKDFIKGCANNGIDEKLAKVIWDKIETFAGYGFNKSHSVSYAFVAYQTAFLKANYPEEFMCALLTSESGNLDKVALYVEECRRMNIAVLPPDVSKSHTDFTVEDGNIHFGLSAIKNVGEGATEAIVREREENGAYKDIFDFCSRLDTRLVNKRLVESLNKAGAFAGTGWKRVQVAAVLDAALGEAQSTQRDRDAGQTSLFDISGMEETVEVMHERPDMDEWPERELLQYEKDVLGLYASGHPLSGFKKILDHFNTLDLEHFKEVEEGTEVNLGGIINTIKTHLTKRGKMAFLGLDTLKGSCEITVFSDLFEKRGGIIVPDTPVMINAKISYRNNAPGLLANDIYLLRDAEQHLTRAIHIRLGKATAETADELSKLLGVHTGNCDVYLHCAMPGNGEVIVHANKACLAKPSSGLRCKVEDLLGEGAYYCSAGMGLPTHAEPKKPAHGDKPWKRRN